MRRLSRLEQAAGVRLVTLGDGLGRGVRVLEFRTGSGFAFDVLVDRCFDVGRCEFGRGAAELAVGRGGVVAPWYYEPGGGGGVRAWGGGMVVTCGLDHTLVPGRDGAAQFNRPHVMESVEYGLHRRVGGLPARLTGYGERWDGDECVLWAEGEVLQSAVFGESLMLPQADRGSGGRVFVCHHRRGRERRAHAAARKCSTTATWASRSWTGVGATGEQPVARRPTTGWRSRATGVYRRRYGMRRRRASSTRSSPRPGACPSPWSTGRSGSGRTGLPVQPSCRITRCGGCSAKGPTRSASSQLKSKSGRFDARDRGELQWLEPGQIPAI